MNKYARVLVAIIFAAGLSMAAKAETRTEIVVTLPFGFVVSGETLPAGTYMVSRFSDNRFNALKLTNDDNGSSVFVLPAEVESASTYRPKVSFEKVGEQHFLSAIQTADDVYNIPVSRSVIMEAAAKLHSSVSVSGGSGGN
jgi:hypothetical protein